MGAYHTIFKFYLYVMMMMRWINNKSLLLLSDHSFYSYRCFSTTMICFSGSSNIPGNNSGKDKTNPEDITLSVEEESKLRDFKAIIEEVEKEADSYISGNNIFEGRDINDELFEALKMRFGANSNLYQKAIEYPRIKDALTEVMKYEEFRSAIVEWSRGSDVDRDIQEFVAAKDLELSQLSDRISDLETISTEIGIPNQESQNMTDSQIIEDVRNRVSNLESRFGRVENMSGNIERIAEVSTQGAQFVFRNQDSIDLFLLGVSVASPLFAYNRIYSSYARSTLYQISPNHSREDQRIMIRSNKINRLRFHAVALPMLAFVFYYGQEARRKFSLFNFPSQNSGIGGNDGGLGSLIFFGFMNKSVPSKNKGLISPLLLFIINLIMSYLIIDCLGSFFPIFRSKYNLYFFLIVIWLWSLSVFILNIIELYIILIYALDPKYIKLSSPLPQIIKNWYIRLEEESRLKSEAWILRSKLAWIVMMGIMLISFSVFTVLISFIV